MTSFVQYNGQDSVYTLGRTWQPGDKISVKSLCKDFGERAGDSSGGDIFINWLSNTLNDKPKFSLHVDNTDLSALASQGKVGGRETVESGPIAVSTSAESAATALRERAHGQQVAEQDIQQSVQMTETEPPSTRTKRSERRKSSTQQVKESLKEESKPMTGDMLQQQAVRDAAGGASDVYVAQPEITKSEPQPRSESSPVLVANPQPSLSPANKVSTGREGILTNMPEVRDDFNNIVPQDRRVVETAEPVLEVVTGDDLASVNPQTEPSNAASSSPKASAIGGKKRPAFQGSAAPRDVTLDQIVREPNPQKAADAVSRCKDRSVLSVAKTQMSQSGGSQKLIDKIDNRIQFLRSRGL